MRGHELDFWKASVSSPGKWRENDDSVYFTKRQHFACITNLHMVQYKCKPLEKIVVMN